MIKQCLVDIGQMIKPILKGRVIVPAYLGYLQEGKMEVPEKRDFINV